MRQKNFVAFRCASCFTRPRRGRIRHYGECGGTEAACKRRGDLLVGVLPLLRRRLERFQSFLCHFHVIPFEAALIALPFIANCCQCLLTEHCQFNQFPFKKHCRSLTFVATICQDIFLTELAQRVDNEEKWGLKGGNG